MIDRITQSLSQALRYPTISNKDADKENRQAFEAFHTFLKCRYPLMYEYLEVKRFGDSLLYIWKGELEEGELFLAHMDVVPVQEQDWELEPFNGEVKDGFVWGRGALDDKGNLILLHEAMESLIEEGFQPKRSIYLAIGADEEVGGYRGAKVIADYLKEKGVKIHSVLDEGGAVTIGAIKGPKKPLALIGLAEKGSSNFRLRIKGSGGHSSMPPSTNAIGIMSKCIAKLEAHPPKARLVPTVQAMFETLAPHVGAPGQVLRRVKRLFPLLEKGFRQVPATNALIRTTYAVTMIEGGTAPNVLPGKVEAVINARILQGESVESVLKDLRKILGEEVEIEIEMREEPSKVTPSDTEEFSLLREAIEHHFGDVIVAPYLMSGATDARHYGPLSRHIFRFSPVVMEAEEVSLVHSADERISIENLEKGYLFFRDYIRQRSMR